MAKLENWPNGYQSKVEEILGTAFSEEGQLGVSLSLDTIDEAKLTLKKVRLMQKQLRQVKKEANQDMREIREAYKVERENVTDSGFFTGLLVGKKAAGRDRQRKRADLSQRQKDDLLPYENVKSTIDSTILYIDRAKLDIETFIAESSTE